MVYVLATKRNDELVTTSGGSSRAMVAALPGQAWWRISAGPGAHGLRGYDWARVALRIWWAWRRGHWLLARRTRTTGELACSICHGPRRATLAQLAAVAGARWAIEECFQQAKQTCGLDDYQVRDYQAWYTHITLAKLAYAALTGVREQTKEAAAEPARA